MKGYIIFEHYNKLIECKEILDGDCSCMISDYPNATFSGVINRVTGARCNKDDTYDFETGALIALMKMCGREKVIKACDELYKDDNYKNALQEVTESLDSLSKKYDLVKAGYDYWKGECKKLDKENKELHKNIDELFESEQHTKTELGRLYFEKHRLEEENEKLKLDCEMLQHGYNDTDKKIELTADSLIEQNRAFTRKCVDEWLYKSPTKREEMWDKIFALHKESDVIIEVKKEDINTFLHELENKIPEITWVSGVKMFETKYTIGDIYKELKIRDRVYFRLWKVNKLSYSSDQYIYPYRELKHIEYLPPMRWDLFKKGRLAVKVNYDNYKEFYEACEKELGKKPSTVYPGGYTVSICKKDGYFGYFEIFTIEDQKKAGKKIVDWEDVK